MQLVPVDPHIAFAQARWDALTARERAGRIVAALNVTGLKKADLAERLNLRYASVHAWARGDSECDWARWMAISLALGLPQTWEPTTDAYEEALAEVDAIRPREESPKKPARKPKAH